MRHYVEIAGDPSIEVVEDFEIATVDGATQAGFGSSAFRKEDTDFIEAYNRELEELKASGKHHNAQCGNLQPGAGDLFLNRLSPDVGGAPLREKVFRGEGLADVELGVCL